MVNISTNHNKCNVNSDGIVSVCILVTWFEVTAWIFCSWRNLIKVYHIPSHSRLMCTYFSWKCCYLGCLSRLKLFFNVLCINGGQATDVFCKTYKVNDEKHDFLWQKNKNEKKSLVWILIEVMFIYQKWKSSSDKLIFLF